ncbi:SHOCT domain-containing protein [Streptomyces sp. GS7]|uniref:SHOCT domain-containing protein n=1 Tax=Streptomyces sp. GS7 TaxID=2692234 RepID=UPI001318E5FE|nr:SHOCT domain-containing protein [Streptomyces sp. GS7]QHC23447.1 hypothetical protein GR130_20720 [Streptomyces sp. GS7]
MAVTVALFWGLLIAGVIALIHYFTGARRETWPGPSGTSGPAGERVWGPGQGEDLLAERFARGEIDEEEYKRRLAVLREPR